MRIRTTLAAAAAVGLCSTLMATSASALSRTPWEMHDGLEVTSSNPYGLLAFTCNPTQHGAICEYDVATVPPAADGGWGPAPNGDTIGFSLFPSRVCQAPITCLKYGDFTYFQTFVDIEATATVTTFTIAFQGMDDGSRVSIYNSAYPAGLVIPGSYVFLGGTGTTNLAPFVVAGEVNRVVITQVDDCCSHNNLHSATVVLNGVVIPPDPDDCPDDPDKDEPGICGCGVPDTDTDGDGTADCEDGCPEDATKTAAGVCGCGVADTDTDGDGTADCNDGCPEDADKTAAGICGCGISDVDADGDGFADACEDLCPGTTPDAPTSGLGTNRWADLDGDGTFDTVAPKGKGPKRSYTSDDTAGCSCTQIIDATGVGEGHSKHGCSISTMDCWTACAWDADVLGCFLDCKN